MKGKESNPIVGLWIAVLVSAIATVVGFTLVSRRLSELSSELGYPNRTYEQYTEKDISDLDDGETAYTVSWAFMQDETGRYVAGIYNSSSAPHGTLNVCIKRAGDSFKICGGVPEWTDRTIDWDWIPIDT